MRRKSKMKTKNRRPLATTLGKAPHIQKSPDLSHIRKPIDTSIFGLRQVLSLFETSTAEVQDYITYECEILYECRICRTIFRSLANFILHKRNYCTEKYTTLDLTRNRESEFNGHILIDDEVFPSNGQSQLLKKAGQKDMRNERSLSPVIQKLVEKHKIREIAKEALQEDLSITPQNKSENTGENALCLEKIETTNTAVFQTVSKNFTRENKDMEFMKTQVMEIHGILDSDEAIIGPDGKICNFETNKKKDKPYISKSNLVCTECDLKFSTKKTLTYHIKYKHNETRTVYPCPECKELLANAWCVYRHLYKVHRKTSTQIRKLREVIHNSAIRKDQQLLKKKDKKQVQEKADDENQWIKNVEADNDLQMCGGCGKRFERKAALYSHSQMCIKRIAVCNTIKENSAKPKYHQEDKNKDKMMKHEKHAIPVTLKGSKKRKPSVVISYKTVEKVPDHLPSIEHGKSNKVDEVADIDSVPSNEVSSSIHSGSNQSTDDEDYCSEDQEHPQYPSIDALDTESVMNIIGVSSKRYHECLQMKGSLDTEETNIVHVKSSDEYIDESVENKISFTEGDFDNPSTESDQNRKDNSTDMKINTLSINVESEECNNQNFINTSEQVQNHDAKLSEYYYDETAESVSKNYPIRDIDLLETCTKSLNAESEIKEQLLNTAQKNVHTVEAFNQFSEKMYHDVPSDMKQIDMNTIKGNLEVSDTINVEISIDNTSEIHNCASGTDLEEFSKIRGITCNVEETDALINQDKTIISNKELANEFEQISPLNKTAAHQCQNVSSISGDSNNDTSQTSGIIVNSESCVLLVKSDPFSGGIDVCNNADLAESTSVDKSLYTDVNIADTAYMNNDVNEEFGIIDTISTDIEERVVSENNSRSDTGANKLNTIDTDLLDNELFGDLQTKMSCNEQNEKIGQEIKNIYLESTNEQSPNLIKNPGSPSPEVIIINDDDSDPVVQNDENIEYIIHSHSESDDYENETKDPEEAQQCTMSSLQNLKRKRTLSLDYPFYSKKKKAVKIIDENEVLTDDHDVSFIAKAAPYMNQNTMSCISCDADFPSLYVLLWHMSQHFSWFRFQCSRCPFMSFNKYDCANHAKKVHSVPECLLNSIVLPIPNWKTVLMSHEFCYLNLSNISSDAQATESSEKLKEETIITHNSEVCYGGNYTNNASISDMREPVDTTNYSRDPETMLNFEKSVNSKTYFDNPYIEISSSSSDDSDMTLDDGKSNISLEESIVIANEKTRVSTTNRTKTSRTPSEKKTSTHLANGEDLSQNKDRFIATEKIRPIRNRVKSVKTSQSDFIYDLHNVLQLNNTHTDKTTQSRLKKSDASKKAPVKNISCKTLRVYSKSSSDVDQPKSQDSKNFEA